MRVVCTWTGSSQFDHLKNSTAESQALQEANQALDDVPVIRLAILLDKYTDNLDLRQ